MTSRGASGTTVAGIDSSTQSTKVVIVDAETGRILQARSAAHPDGTQVDPRTWWSALAEATGGDGETTSLRGGVLDDVAAVGVSAQQHGMVALDAEGLPVHDALLWNDVRSAPQAEALRRHWGPQWWAREVGVVPVPSFTVTKLAWLAETRPDLAQRVDQVMLPHDYLTWRLRGAAGEATTDASDASGTGYYSVPQRRYRDDIIEYAFGRVPRLPRVLDPADTAGSTATQALVSAGCGDNAGAAIGLGLRGGEVAVSIGTSGTVFSSTSTDLADETGSIAGFADATGRNLPLMAMINCARVIADTAGFLGVSLEQLEQLARRSAPDAGGLVLVPFFGGERTPNVPGASASLLGLTRENYRAENLARAAYLAVTLSLGYALDLLRERGVAVDRVVVVGGGARSGLLLETAAALWQAEIEVPRPSEYVALGAARQAAWALGGEPQPPVWPRIIDQRIAGAEQTWAAEVRERYRGLVLDQVAQAW